MLILFLTVTTTAGCRSLSGLGNLGNAVINTHSTQDPVQVHRESELSSIERGRGLDDRQLLKHNKYIQNNYKPKSKYPEGYTYLSEEDRSKAEYLKNKVEVIDTSKAKTCNKIKDERIIIDIQNSISYYASLLGANAVLIHKEITQGQYTYTDLTYYDCDLELQFSQYKQKRYDQDLGSLWTVMVGSYTQRQGLLNDLGDVGTSVGFQYNNLYDKNWGFHFMFSLDHFFDTNSELLRPKLRDEDFTNYLWAFGPSYRQKITQELFIKYDLGLGFNFIEIDTYRTNYEISDEEATTFAFSLVHKLGAYYKFNRNIVGGKDLFYGTDYYLGLSILHYNLPNVFGQFLKDTTSLDNYAGSSTAIYLEFGGLSF